NEDVRVSSVLQATSEISPENEAPKVETDALEKKIDKSTRHEKEDVSVQIIPPKSPISVECNASSTEYTKETSGPLKKPGKRRTTQPKLIPDVESDFSDESAFVEQESASKQSSPASVHLRKTIRKKRRRAGLIKLKRCRKLKNSFSDVAQSETKDSAKKPLITLSSETLSHTNSGTESKLLSATSETKDAALLVSYTSGHDNEGDEEFDESTMEVVDSGILETFSSLDGHGRRNDAKEVNEIFKDIMQDADFDVSSLYFSSNLSIFVNI
ncbi:unnamed protein product, partial [Gongylonema pulchrum]|uniref:KMT2A methyltransferase n=1 Tax=Gongylonema pulchrum TaxID=637853 RepID=A0A183ET11_9BILA